MPLWGSLVLVATSIKYYSLFTINYSLTSLIFHFIIFHLKFMTLLERLNTSDRFASGIGAQLVEVREGYARAELTVEDRHLNAAGVCQGGVIYTLADLAFAGVCNSHGTLTLGVNTSISFMKSAQLGEKIIAEATEVLDHHKLPYCDIRVRNEQGEVLAGMTGLGYRTRKDYEFDALM